jgi:hypothetical protein
VLSVINQDALTRDSGIARVLAAKPAARCGFEQGADHLKEFWKRHAADTAAQQLQPAGAQAPHSAG